MREHPLCAARATCGRSPSRRAPEGCNKIRECLRHRQRTSADGDRARTGAALRGLSDMPPKKLIDQVGKDVPGHRPVAERHAGDIVSVYPGEVSHDLVRPFVPEDKPRVTFVSDAAVAFDDRPVRCEKLRRAIKIQHFVLGPAALVTSHSGKRPCSPIHGKPPPSGIPSTPLSTPRGFYPGIFSRHRREVFIITSGIEHTIPNVWRV